MRNVVFWLLWLTVMAGAQVTVPLVTETFSIAHPKDWESRRSNFAQAVLLYPAPSVADPGTENFHITVDQLSDNMSFDMYTFMAKHTIESGFPGLKLARSQPISVGKLKGHRFEYAGPHAGQQLQMVQVMLMAGDRGYTLYFTASPANFRRFGNQAEAIIRSFKPL